MEDYAKLTLTVTAILDLKGKVLVAVGWQDICTKFHRVHPGSALNCTESDLFLAGQVKRGEYVAYKCKSGLWDVVTPLYVAGTHMGNIYTGQFFYDDEVIDRKAFEAQAEAYGFDKAAYLAALDQVPRFSRDQVKQLMDFLVKFTDLVSRFTLSNIRSATFIREQARSAAALRQSEAALRENRAMLALILDTIPQSVFWKDLEGQYLGCNKAFSVAAGLKDPTQIIGKTDFDLPWAPEDTEAYRADDRQVLETGQPKFHIIEPLQQANGTHLLIDTSKAPLLDGHGQPFGVLGIYEDITERKRVEAQSLANQARLAEAQSLAHLGNWELDLRTGERTWSEETFRIFGIEPGGPVPSDEVLKAFIHPDDWEAVMRTHAESLANRTPYQMSYRLLLADGSLKHVHAQGQACYDPEGRPIKSIGTVQDISEVRRGEDEREKLQTQLQHIQKMESLGNLAGGVAHDMNNVLGAILGLATANIQTQPIGSPARHAFETIIKAAERGGKMVKSLLSFSRQTAAEERPLDVNKILQEEVSLLEHTTLSRVHIEMDLAEGIRPILGDESALTHAIMNLCVNAVDAMPDTGTLTLRTRNAGDHWVEVQVQDNGTGMPKAILDRAMDPFFTTKEVGKGTGLGLSMVYSTVKAHQGHLEIHSEPGHGTCVSMRFPVCAPKAELRTPEEEPCLRPSPGGLKVLIIDDDDLIQTSVGMMLETLGHTVCPAPTGELAMEQLEGGLRPDLVILDMNMPGIGGPGTLPLLRSMHPALPVLLATGRVDQAALDLIASDVNTALLSKPFSMNEVKAKFEWALRKA
jgi:PAS domain S-box-containing protein